ncbi:MAG: CHASE domain-containing protein, partial [Akkermansiaceae bacterium]|nr:CHASE domain-containing protein [Verrucomicrobiales bacterium]
MIPPQSNLERRLPPPWIGYVLGLGMVLSLAVFFVIRGWEKRDLEKQAAAVTGEQIEKLRVSMLRSMEVLHSIVSLHAAEGCIERNQFRQFVQQALARQPELQALSWNPLVPATRRSELETAARAAGLSGFSFREKNPAGELVPAAERSEYVPVYFIEPVEPNAAALGYDLDSDSCRRQSLEQARDTGQPVASAPLRLAQGPDNQVGFLVVLPAFFGANPVTVNERRAGLAGFAVAVFRVSDLVGETFRDLRARGIEVKVFDDSPAGEMIFTNAEEFQKPGGTARLEFANRHWSVVYAPTRSFIAAQSHLEAWLVLAGGLAFSLL